MTKDTPVKYLDESQPEFIAECEELLQRAREGKLIGLTLIEFWQDGNLEGNQLGIVPEDIAIIQALHGFAGEITANMAVDRMFDALEAQE